MEAPISPFDGTILMLPGKLDRLLRHGCNLPKGATDEIPLIKGDLEKIIVITSNLENHHATMARCWRKEVRELSYDLEDFVDQYEHAVQRMQRWGGRCSSPPYQRLAQEGPPNKPALQFWPWMKEWNIASNRKEWNKRTRRERKNKTKDGVDEPLLSSSPASTFYRKIKIKAALPWLREKLRLRLWMANEIREFSMRVQEALQRYNSYNLDTIDGSSSTRCIDAYSASGNSMSKEDNTYVGTGAALEKLEELLMSKHDHRHQKLKVVSIVGFGGIGKTTLAIELYRKFGQQFDCRAFVRTTQKPDVRRILISMLSQVRPHQPPDNWTVHGLISTIRTHLQDKRYLVIVEDLSAASTWDIFKSALPDSNCCSRILATTEIEDLALQCSGHDPKHVYKMKPLGEENSRKLFFSSVFGPQHECPPELKEISYDIISKCGGLPLAIVTVARVLSSQLPTEDQWHYVNNSIGYNLLKNHSLEGMKQVLDLSYNNLPHHLKACILYTGLYEEDIIIYKDDLVNQWIAEGFIQATEGQDEKEIARSFFDRLISAKLILPVDINRNGEVLSCTVHHMVLNLVIRYKSTEENFVAAIHHSQATTTIADNVRRLSLQFGNAADAKAPVNVTLTHIRTLAIWGVFKCLPSVVQFPLLQVLILHFWGNTDSISFDITGMSELLRLRYLKVTSNVILKLCTKMRSMQSLETLTIDARGSEVPSDIVQLPGLLHLSLPAETDLPNGIGDMTSLHTLGYFDLSSNSMENVQSLRTLTNLEDLRLTCSTVEPDNLNQKLHFALNSIFGRLRNLKSLTMVPRASSNAKSIDDAGAAGTIISVGLPSTPALLRSLEVSPRICIFFCLPKWIRQLHKLCVLKFGVRKIDMDGVDILGGLPGLAVLSLYVHIKPEMGIVIRKTGFPVIKYFKFKCCDPCLKFEEGAMPNLRKLKLAFNACNADQQSTIPVGIIYLSELKEVSAKIGGAGPEESHTRAAKSAFRDAIRMHDRIQRVNIQCVKQIIFGNDDESNITPVEDSPRTGKETTHFQDESEQRKDESKQRNEEEAVEAVDVSEDDCWVVLQSSSTSFEPWADNATGGSCSPEHLAFVAATGGSCSLQHAALHATNDVEGMYALSDGEDSDAFPRSPPSRPQPKPLSGLFHHKLAGGVGFAHFDPVTDLQLIPDPTFAAFFDEPVAVLASTRGLVCLGGARSGCYYVANPVTLTRARLPAPSNDHVAHGDPAVVIAFDLDPRDADGKDADSKGFYHHYHVVVAFHAGDGVYAFESFSSRAWAWTIGNGVVDAETVVPGSGVGVLGCAFWRTNLGLLLCYEPVTGGADLVPAPAEVLQWTYWELGEMEGTLCVTCMDARVDAVVAIRLDFARRTTCSVISWTLAGHFEGGCLRGRQDVKLLRSQGKAEVVMWDPSSETVVAMDIEGRTTRTIRFIPGTGNDYTDFIPYVSSLAAISGSGFGHGASTFGSIPSQASCRTHSSEVGRSPTDAVEGIDE